MRPEGLCADITLTTVGFTVRVTTPGAVDSVIAADPAPTGGTRGRIGVTDGTITRRTRTYVSRPEGIIANFAPDAMCSTQRVIAASTIDSVVRTNRISTGTAGRGVGRTDITVARSTRGQMRGPEQIRTDLTSFSRLSAVIPAAPVTRDGIVVTPDITARLTGHSIINADRDFARGTGTEMLLANRVSALFAAASVRITVQVTVNTAFVEV
mgnify:CR=1 FL=1